jgi:general secretion pathway protein G
MSPFTPRRAFTLVEILIVVVILAILTAAIIPQFSSSTTDTTEAVMLQNLSVLRGQAGAYRVQHGGLAPTSSVVDQLTKKTNVDGTTSGTPTLGPYVLLVPPNPQQTNPNLQTTIGIVNTDPTANLSSAGWIYNTVNGRFYSATDYTK